MKKITKIGALSLALCALVIAFKASADIDTGVTKTVSLVLNDSNNSCTVNNYNLGTHNVSSAAQSATPDTQKIECSLLKSPSYLMTISLTNLSGGSTNAIPSTQFTGTFSSWTKNGTLVEFTTTDIAFTTEAQTIYTKTINTIGNLSGDLTIGGIIPEGQPAGSYTGELNLYIQPNS